MDIIKTIVNGEALFKGELEIPFNFMDRINNLSPSNLTGPYTPVCINNILLSLMKHIDLNLINKLPSMLDGYVLHNTIIMLVNIYIKTNNLQNNKQSFHFDKVMNDLFCNTCDVIKDKYHSFNTEDVPNYYVYPLISNNIFYQTFTEEMKYKLIEEFKIVFEYNEQLKM